MSDQEATTFTFLRHPHSDVRYLVKSKQMITHEAASKAFQNYILNHLVIPQGPAEVEIAFEEWFPAAGWRSIPPKIEPD